MTTVAEILRAIPSVHGLLDQPECRRLLEQCPRHLVLEEVQAELDQLRRQIQAGFVNRTELDDSLTSLPARVAESLTRRLTPSLRPVINATGILIHTNAGRAPLSPAALQAMTAVGTSYSNLEYDLSRRRRGHRDQHFESRTARLLGCEAATVCNNNAGALFLILTTLARGREVLVSRGELVEIGGSFRIPDIMRSSGAVLREVGTTNRTRLSDYQEAAGPETALILKVHASNFRIIGFTAETPTAELAELARRKGIPLVEDVGSGLLFESHHPALRREPSVAATLRAGADLVCFSGDKLLGGPQAGLIVGKKRLVRRIRKNPLMRALRVDKTTYAGLEQVLIDYEKGVFQETVPIHRMLHADPGDLERRNLALAQALGGSGLTAEPIGGVSLAGGGSAPEEHIPTRLLAVRHRDLSVNRLEETLRLGAPPVLTRIEEDRLLLDLRTVFPEQDEQLKEALLACC